MIYILAAIVPAILVICFYMVIYSLIECALDVCPIVHLISAVISLVCLVMWYAQVNLDFIKFTGNFFAYYMILWACLSLKESRFYKDEKNKDKEYAKNEKYLKFSGILMLLGSITSIVLRTMNFTFASSLLMLFTPITLLAVFKFVLKRKIEFTFD